VKAKLKRGILLVLLSWDGLPMDEESLVSAVQAHARPGQPTAADVGDALKDVEANGVAAGVTDSFLGKRTWTLTLAGIHQARQLR
jgi:hypothetical protein